MAVKSIADLAVNKEYYMVLVSGGKASKVRLLGIMNQFNKTELYLHSLTKRLHYTTTIQPFDELGLGDTPEEAKSNYGKLVDAVIENAYLSDEEIRADLQKIQTAPRSFTYFNQRF